MGDHGGNIIAGNFHRGLLSFFLHKAFCPKCEWKEFRVNMQPYETLLSWMSYCIETRGIIWVMFVAHQHRIKCFSLESVCQCVKRLLKVIQQKSQSTFSQINVNQWQAPNSTNHKVYDALIYKPVVSFIYHLDIHQRLLTQRLIFTPANRQSIHCYAV